MKWLIAGLAGIAAGSALTLAATYGGGKLITSDSEVQQGFIAPRYIKYAHEDFDRDGKPESAFLINGKMYGLVEDGDHADLVPYTQLMNKK